MQPTNETTKICVLVYKETIVNVNAIKIIMTNKSEKIINGRGEGRSKKGPWCWKRNRLFDLFFFFAGFLAKFDYVLEEKCCLTPFFTLFRLPGKINMCSFLLSLPGKILSFVK